MNGLFFEVSAFYNLYILDLEAPQDTSELAGTYCKTEHVRKISHIKAPVYMKQSPLMYFQMSQDGNWIVSTDLGGMDIKLEQMSVHQDPSTLGLRWKKAGLGLRVVGSNYNTGPCNWYKKSGTTNGAVYLDDTSTTKPICNNIHCGQNEGTQGNIQEDENIEGAPRNIQAEGKTEMLDHTPIYIGGGLAVVIVTIGFCLGFKIVRHPHSHSSDWLGNLIK